MTLRTLSEITATCTKATRGAGCPWGLAEEAGLAARRLSEHGFPGAQAVAELLATPRACACGGGNGPPCGLATLATLLDDPPAVRVDLPATAAPLLLVGFALAEAAQARGWSVDWPGGEVICGPEGVTLSGDLPAPDGPMTLTPTGAAARLSPDWRARPVDPQAWAALEALAARLLVPESDASRAAGAGPDA